MPDRSTPVVGTGVEPIYPCDRCGVLRTKAQGGTVFTVCDDCWDASEPSTAATPGTPEQKEQEGDARVDGSCSSGTGRATASSGEPTPALVQASDGAVHEWFELTYAQYLTVPRSVLQSMPHEWQERFVRCLCELDDAIDWRPKDGQYWVRLKDGEGRYVRDPFMDYQRGRRRIPLRNSDGGSNVA